MSCLQVNSDISELPTAPVMDDILKDISDGTNLCLLISFYCPKLVKFSGKDTAVIGTALVLVIS